jgi:hypothetical protein
MERSALLPSCVQLPKGSHRTPNVASLSRRDFARATALSFRDSAGVCRPCTRHRHLYLRLSHGTAPVRGERLPDRVLSVPRCFSPQD